MVVYKSNAQAGICWLTQTVSTEALDQQSKMPTQTVFYGPWDDKLLNKELTTPQTVTEIFINASLA